YRRGGSEKRLVLRITRSGGRGACSDCREICRTNGADRRARFQELRLSRLQRFIGDADLLLKRIELGVAVNFPPLSLGDCVAWLRGLPGAHFLVVGRNIGRRPDVFRPDRASAEQKYGN